MIQHWERHRFADEKNCSNDDSDDYDGDEDEVEEQTFPSDKLTNLSWHPYCPPVSSSCPSFFHLVKGMDRSTGL